MTAQQIEIERAPEKVNLLADPLPVQPTSEQIWRQKYCLADHLGEAVDADMDATLRRVAKALSETEIGRKKQNYWQQRFLWALRQGAMPAGRILSNAGAQAYKPATSTINCTVSGTIEDSMAGILGKNLEAGLTLKAGCGIGYEFSSLRPKGAYVSGAGAHTSGPLSFMDVFDKMCFTVSSAGGRRGAQMATFDVGHPDVEDFIRAKREDGRLRQFNLSLLITDDFMRAVQRDQDWPLAFPISTKEQVDAAELADTNQVVWRDWSTTQGYVTNEVQKVACRISKVVRAQRLWNLIMSSTYDYAEPGFILIDRVNQFNNNWFCENIRATNPCGEQPLPEYGSCLLGSVNLTRFVLKPFTAQATFDWPSFKDVVAVFTRMLDNVVEINGLALPQQVAELQRKRRHGMGYLGLGSALIMLGMVYGDEASVAFTEKVSKELALQGYRTGVELAQEKGPAPIMEESFEVTQGMLTQRPSMVADGYQVGDQVLGKVLWAGYSEYMQKLIAVDPQLHQSLIQKGCRFTHHSSIAPTGTIALSMGNNASNGIEPSFAHHYLRNIIMPGKKTKQQVSVYSYELLAYKQWVDANVDPNQLPACFVPADELSPRAHIAIQAAAQKWVDSSISKTINVATDIDFEDFKNIYQLACEQGLKGCTTFRFNPEVFQGVLVKEEELSQTHYRFAMADGTSVELAGNESVIYDGEEHIAANLFDALKEGYYGKH
ncbi:MAG: adenosylcobalamin-dependent ribonucleoside-diphosphate reductase [Oceanospirillaceae bacterium]|jgi:ribonucleoside-diphosphate reductase alpha chain|nr:adenosylcobalamin-dependent ribonucleoside-diphosphate reductase [Oceanospirillaceae bacterium]MBT6077543.1 adenosylcobalamin-dependent ribonucleoside-diphosphate reductase [Oceanospirillaceae bacterium]